MAHATRFVAVVVLVALAVGAPVQAQTPLIDDLRMRAEAGDAEAQYDLGVMYENGRGVPQDDAQSVRWQRMAAVQGHALAQYMIGFRYSFGWGVPQDDVYAYAWVNLAVASSGERVAPSRLNYRGAPQTGSPMTYALDGVQYLVVAISGGNYSGELVAFRLPEA